ncbi:MAG: hypothetical protein KHX69_13445 [Clostridium sp.]|nr:hypothetical protein [Clostridium sp.]
MSCPFLPSIIQEKSKGCHCLLRGGKEFPGTHQMNFHTENALMSCSVSEEALSLHPIKAGSRIKYKNTEKVAKIKDVF